MKPSKNTLSLALAALALLAAGTGHALASLPNYWTNTGPSSGGGFVIVGSGAIDEGPLGPSSSPVFLSPNGFNIITLDAGSTATSSLQQVIDLESINNTLNNYGTINNILNGGYGVLADSTGNTINNWGVINANVGDAYSVLLYDQNNVLNNYGTITGAYDAVYLDATSVTVNNHGTISSPDYAFIDYGTGITVNNWGMITSPYDAVYEDAAGSVYNNYKGATISGDSYAFYMDAGTENFTLNNWGAVSSQSYGIFMTETTDSTINNWGTISGPTAGIYMDWSSGQTPFNTVNNWGTISSGNIGIFMESHDTLNNWGNISGGSYGVELYDQYNTVTNHFGGTITGNTRAVYLDDDNQTLTNWGTLSTPSGAQAVVYADDGNSVITNHGYILGNGATAINLANINNETVNLVGHSVVEGNIVIVGNNNVVNFNLTGLSPAKITSLNNQLVAQGVNSGNVTNSVVFTLNGVNYNIDPAIVNFHASSYQLQGVTPNQQAIGASLDSLNSVPTPAQMALFNAIDASGNVPAALQALSPQAFSIYGDLAIAESSFLVNSVDARLNNLRDGSESIDTSGMGGDTVAGLTKDDGKSGKEIIHAAATPDRWGFFATGDGLFFRDSGKADTAGTIAGVDGKVGDHAEIGALFAYNNSAVTLDSANSKATIQSFTEGVYGSWHDDGFYANSLAVFTRNDYKSYRNIAIPGYPATANGSTNSNQYTANIDGGYDWNATSRLTVGPALGLQYVHMDLFGFNESGAGAADLSLGGEDMNSLQTRLGLHADYHLLTGKYSSGALDFHAAWQHEYLNDSRPIGASFAGTGLTPFSVQTASPRRDAAVVGTGVNFTFHNRLTLFTEYELEFWSSSTFEQTISGGARISF